MGVLCCCASSLSRSTNPCACTSTLLVGGSAVTVEATVPLGSSCLIRSLSHVPLRVGCLSVPLDVYGVTVQ
jgi:hypothetical protein